MSDRLNIDLSEVDTSSSGGGGWSAFPSGEYRVMVTKSELKTTKAGTGKRLALELTVLSGDLKGRTHWEGLNVVNPNPVAQRIAHEHLAMLADAADLGRDFLQTKGTGALKGKVVLAEIQKAKAKDADFGDSDGYENTVRGYSASGTKAEAKSEQPTAPAPLSADEEPPF